MCEIGLTLSELTWMQKHLRSLMRSKRVSTPVAQFAAKSFRSPSPYGTVLIMSPWNYPVLLTLDPLIDAIAAGNTAVVKPSAYAPCTFDVMKTMIEECFPAHYVAVVDGGRAENQALLQQRFDMIFFTGGKTVGREVLRHAAEYLTPVTLELGGKSPCIVDSTAKIRLAAKRIVFGKYLNCGQTCVAPDYILCDKRIRDELITAILAEIEKQFGKEPLKNPNYGKIINIGSFHCQVTMNGVPRSGYSTAKGAVLMMSKALAAEWAKNNITVNVLGPGYFASEMSAKVANEAYEASIRNNCPMGRRGNPGELNGAMLFLASDASSYVTGQLLLVDGGWTIV